mgnify:CR=1 FL=1
MKRPLLFVLLILLFACGEEAPKVVDFEKNREGTTLNESFDVQYNYYENDRVKARAYAPHLYEPYTGNVGKGDKQIADSGIKVIFFNELGKQTSQLTANRAVLFNREGRARAEGDVVVVNEQGEKLETEKLNWYQKQEQISTDAFVRITRPEEILLGDSMIANTAFSEYKIFKLRGTIAVDE